MCGIFGYVGTEPCLDIITQGLKRLEYRGYDSSGAMVYDRGIQVAKAMGKVSDLLPKARDLSSAATVGMGHTRWASHGSPTEANAHPHYTPALAIVHNGIIENHAELRASFADEEVEFKSETDSEVVLHLVAHTLRDEPEPLAAFSSVMRRIEGLYGIAMFFRDDPQRIYLSRKGASLAIASGNSANLFSSDPAALANHSEHFIFLGDDEIAVLEKDKVSIYDYHAQTKPLPQQHRLQLAPSSVEKSGYQHFMLKEIHEQGNALANTIHRLFDFASLRPREDLLGIDRLDIDRIERIKVTGCGTSHHAGLLSPYFVEEYLQIEATVEVSHELRYRKALIDEKTLMIAMSQSGETADTLSCIEHAKKFSCQTLAICNNVHSSLSRLCDAMIYLECGPEIGVASTKAFTSMVLTYYMFILSIRNRKNKPPSAEIYNIRKLPILIDYVLGMATQIEQIAKQYRDAWHFIYLGRGPSYPIAMESALKLKEISYIHAEGYAGGELKHGPIALIDKDLPVLVIAPADNYFAKTISNAKEVKARGGQIIGLGDPNNKELQSVCAHIIPCPYLDHPILQAIVSAVSLQLFAYYLAVEKGTDIDQPRHLAKSVTVE